MHYTTYIKIVIQNKVIKSIIEEASRWKGTKGASKNLDAYLEKIKEIEEESKVLPETYDSFIKKY